MTKTEKKLVRNYVTEYYADRDGRNPRIMASGAVHITVDGDGTDMSNGCDMSVGVIFAGWANDLLKYCNA